MFAHPEQNLKSGYTLRRRGLLPALECLLSPYFTLLLFGSSNSFIIILSIVLRIWRLFISRIFHFSVRNFFPRTQCFLFLNLSFLFSCYCCDIWCYCWLFSAVCVCSCILNGFVQMRWSFTTLFLFVFLLIPLDCFQRLFIGSQPLIRAWVLHTKELRMLLFIVPVWLLPRVCSCLFYIFYVYNSNIFFWHLSNMNEGQQAAKGCFFLSYHIFAVMEQLLNFINASICYWI